MENSILTIENELINALIAIKNNQEKKIINSYIENAIKLYKDNSSDVELRNTAMDFATKLLPIGTSVILGTKSLMENSEAIFNYLKTGKVF